MSGVGAHEAAVPRQRREPLERTSSRRLGRHVRIPDVSDLVDYGLPTTRNVRGERPRLLALDERSDDSDSDSDDDKATKTKTKSSSATSTPTIIRFIGGKRPVQTLSVTSSRTGDTSRSQAVPASATDAPSTTRQVTQPTWTTSIVVSVSSSTSPGPTMAPEQTSVPDQSSQSIVASTTATQVSDGQGPGARPTEPSTALPDAAVSNNDYQPGQLGRGAEAGIVLGVLAFVAIMLGLLFFFFRRRRSGSEKGMMRLPDEKAAPAAPGPTRTHSNIMDVAIRAAYAVEDGTYDASAGPAAVPATMTPAHVAPDLSIYPPGQVPIHMYRVQSMAPTEGTAASETSWRTWNVDQDRASHQKNWKQRFLS